MISITDLVYLDHNCFQRNFDDLRQVRIRIEALACQEIFTRAFHDEVILIWSFMHLDEVLLCPFPERKYEVLRLSGLCKVHVGPEKEVSELAKTFQIKGGLSTKDAIHLACAFYIKAKYFLTCDDKLIKQSKQFKLEINIMNPIDYIRLEMM